MHLNTQTKLFENLTLQECEELTTWAEKVILEGTFQDPEPYWVTQWLRETQVSSNGGALLALSVVVPQYILLSVIRGQKAYIKTLESDIGLP